MHPCVKYKVMVLPEWEELICCAAVLFRLPLAFVNQSVAEACVLCLLQLAAEGEQVSLHTHTHHTHTTHTHTHHTHTHTHTHINTHTDTHHTHTHHTHTGMCEMFCDVTL